MNLWFQIFIVADQHVFQRGARHW